jgi:hypothetical protein
MVQCLLHRTSDAGLPWPATGCEMVYGNPIRVFLASAFQNVIFVIDFLFACG